jgi:hypothetical protein
MTFYPHWRDVPAVARRWPNSSPAEIACRGTGKWLLNDAALDKLQALRDRLGKALHLAKVTGATLVIAKLDRRSRDAALLLTLRDSGVEFAAVDLPEANEGALDKTSGVRLPGR